MEQSEVLAKVEEARTKVGQAITHMEGTRDEAQDMLTSVSEHFSALNEGFNETLAHFQSETTRARTAAQQVIEALIHAGQAITQGSHENNTGISALNAAAQSLTQDHEAGVEKLDQHGQQLGQRLEATEALFSHTEQGTNHAREEQHGAVTELESALANWRSENQEKSQEQHDAADETVQHLTEDAAQQFLESMTASVDDAKTALEHQQDEIDAFCQDEAQQIRDNRDHARTELEGMLHQMEDTLERLGELVSSSAETMIDGADEAKDLMSMTNIGVQTVIGLFENLQQIFDEIESAWN